MAAEVRRATVRITTRPLADLDVQALLQRSRPGWRWEPTLLEVEHGIRVRVATGLRMRARLVWLLGVRRAWDLWKRAQRLPPAEARPERRDPELLAAVAAVLMSPEFLTIRSRLASTCPQDAWREPEFGRYVIVFTIMRDRGNERLAAFTVTTDPAAARGA